ncbi:serine/threonine-protein kinase [Urbifossiella limnaea]|uniref:Serine/threonine-protein kinase PknB n=1 Tax=Urbifossiella limnaea TaxID=2528023 RepID=A0A517XWP3_9BACT|nr:serine/threonine-protein kinase [Urbifossiella limnaea]QDU21931.1 Serine/threonine-protein kinase PknB [Urbifossiella limnaea]
MPVDPLRLKAVFSEALVRTDSSDRAAYLAAACGDDADLRSRVEALLRASEEPDSLLDEPAPPGPTNVTGTSAPDAHRPESMATGDFGSSGATGTFAGAATRNERAAPAELGTVIAGRYTLVEVIGEGGMGSVYLASQSEPVKRQVAIKLIKTGMDSKAVLARFDAERQALALMDHPNIARIYDGGVTQAGQPFFVMELVKGVPLTEYCDQKRLTVDARLQLFVSVCQAVQHAHQKGIIHRDLKPGNVLVTEVDGRPTPKVIDFGVAKANELKLTDLSFADTGAIVGTPAYMSPEQADPSSMDIDTRTDVYALGVMLYELLTGSPPIDGKQFKRGAILEILRMVREVDPPRPSTKLSTADDLPNIAANRSIEPVKLTKSLRGELDWVVMKALEKDRTRRYETANGFAADIQRYLADEVVEARPPSRGYRLKKFVKRNKVQVLAASLVLLALVGGIVGTSLGLVQAEQARAAEAKRVTERDEALGERNTALGEAKAALGERNAALGKATEALGKADESLRKEALRVKERDQANLELSRQLGNSNFLVAMAGYENRDVKQATERLAKVPASERGWEWDYLKQRTRGGIFTLYGHMGQVSSVCFSPDGMRIVTGSWDNTAKVWDARTGTLLLDLKGHTHLVSGVSFSPDGTRIVTGSPDKTAKIWDARTGKPLLDLKGHAGPVNSLCYSPDGKRIVTAGVTAKVWDAQTGAPLVDLKGPRAAVQRVSFSPDGTRIAGSGYVSFSPGGVGGVSFSPDGTRIVTDGTYGGQVWDASTGEPVLDLKGQREQSSLDTARVWDARTGTPLLDLRGHKSAVSSVNYSPDGTRIVTGSWDKTARVWDARTGTPLLDLTGHTGQVSGVSFSPDGTRIVTGGGNQDQTGEINVWDAQTGMPVPELNGHTHNLTSVSFSPDGTRIVTGSLDKTAKVWDVRTGTLVLDLKGHTSGVTSVSFSPDSTRIVTGSSDTAKVWDARTGTLVLDLKGGVTSVSFSPDGTRLITGVNVNTFGSVTVWDAQTGKHLLKWEVFLGVESLSLSPDGTRVVTGHNTAKVWDVRTGKQLLELDGAGCVSFSPDGSRIVTGGGVTAGLDNAVKIWDASTGKHLVDLRGHGNLVTSVSFSPGGTRLVTGSWDNTAKVWDTRTGTPLVELQGGRAWVKSVCFSPDGTRIVTASGQTAKIWGARTSTLGLELNGTTGKVTCMSFSPDGTRFFTGGRTAKVRDVRTGKHLLDLPVSEVEEVTSASFSPDGTRIATGTNDGTIRVWDALTGKSLFAIEDEEVDGPVTSVSFSPDGTRIVTASPFETTAKVWNALTGKHLFDLPGHERNVRTAGFSLDGKRIVTEGGWNYGPTGEWKVWDAQTGREIKGEPIPQTLRFGELSPDGKIFAHRDGDRIVLIPSIPEARELEYRQVHTRPNYWRYLEGYTAARQTNDPVAARFYLDRILSIPEHRTTARFSERNASQADPLVIARTGFHHTALAKTPYDRGTVALLAVRGDRLARRLVAQQLLRDGKPGPAIPLLFMCMTSRPSTSPPVEELLLAQACLDLKQPDEARRFYKAATEWLDRPRDPKDNLGVGFSAANSDPRRNPFDWEAWHECDVFRAEVEKALAKG